jgi:hypothetical protein
MDKVRFGRALGFGAREAAKALMKAADAATAPDPRAVQVAPAAAPVAAPAPRAVIQRATATRAGLKEGGKRFGEAAWAPITRAGGVLWLEVTGVLFGLFAAVSGVAVWRDRNNFAAGGIIGRHAWFALGMFLVFAYCTVSSYVKAGRRARR